MNNSCCAPRFLLTAARPHTFPLSLLGPTLKRSSSLINPWEFDRSRVDRLTCGWIDGRIDYSRGGDIIRRPSCSQKKTKQSKKKKPQQTTPACFYPHSSFLISSLLARLLLMSIARCSPAGEGANLTEFLYGLRSKPPSGSYRGAGGDKTLWSQPSGNSTRWRAREKTHLR